MRSESIKDGLFELTNEFQKKEIQEITDLQLTYLPESRLSIFGDYFLRNFFFKKLPQSKVIRVFGYKMNNQTVGFAIISGYSSNLMSQAIKKNFSQFIQTFFGLMMLHPAKLFSGVKSMFTGEQPKIEKGENCMLLSIAVIPEHRGQSKSSTGERIGEQLLKRSVQVFAESGNVLVLWVLKDNKRATEFYLRNGGKIIRETSVHFVFRF